MVWLVFFRVIRSLLRRKKGVSLVIRRLLCSRDVIWDGFWIGRIGGPGLILIRFREWVQVWLKFSSISSSCFSSKRAAFLSPYHKAKTPKYKQKHTKLNQSALWLYPFPVSISGAIYYGVPHTLYVICLSVNITFDSPKSVNLICPSLSKRMFSGLRSLYMILRLCRY